MYLGAWIRVELTATPWSGDGIDQGASDWWQGGTGTPGWVEQVPILVARTAFPARLAPDAVQFNNSSLPRPDKSRLSDLFPLSIRVGHHRTLLDSKAPASFFGRISVIAGDER